MIYSYEAVIEKQDKHFFYVCVPDLHTCATSGVTRRQAIKNIKDALAGCLAVSEDYHWQIQKPTHQTGDTVLITVDTDKYRKRQKTAKDMKPCTLAKVAML